MFTFKGCREVARLVGEVEDIRQVLENMKRMITGQGLEEESGETGDQVAGWEETEEKEKCERVMTPGNILTEESRKGKETAERRSSEDRGTDIEMEGEHGTEEEETGRQLLDAEGLRPGTQMLATHSYKKNPNGPVGNELDLEEGDTLVYLMEHDDNESWWLAEDVKGQVGYVPAAYLMIILDETIHEEESGKEGHEKRMDGTKIGRKMGQDGERRKTYSAAVIDGCERTSTIYVGDSIVRKTDSRLGKGKDVVVCFSGSKDRACDRESREDRGKRKRRNHSGSRRDEQRGQGRYDGYSEEIPGSTQEDETSESWPDHSVRDSTRDRKQEPRIQELEEDVDQQTSTAAMQGRGRGIRGFMEQLCGEGGDVYEGWTASERKGSWSVADGLKQAVDSGLGNVRYLN